MTGAQHWIDRLGGTSRVARILKVSPATVSEWRTRAIPVDRAVELEAAGFGLVPVEVMRPDVVWVRWPDPDWPHHASGRPLHDVWGTIARRKTEGVAA